ncbi:MAG: DUF3604 domain-containing protein, partial [Planctomycetota bacterium]
QVAEFKADLAAVRHPGDGGGTATLVKVSEPVRAGGPISATIELSVGSEGIAEGGVITFMPEPFWGWSTPQAAREDLPGYTSVTVRRAGEPMVGPRLESATFGGAEAGMLVVTVRGSALEPGDVVELEYGAGPLRARADRYAGRDARLWLGVDADGDGVRSLVASSPMVDVTAREPERAVLLGPTIARPGDTVRYSLSLLDAWANSHPTQDSGEPWQPTVSIAGYAEGWTGPSEVQIPQSGTVSFEVTVSAAVTVGCSAVRLRAVVPLPNGTSTSATSNPAWILAGEPRILWGDLHGHSGLSDGTGAVEDYFEYARDIARLDFIALTDHDHFGMRFLDASPEGWSAIRRATDAFHDPPRFTAILGYEWTSWIHGHRHVLYFDGEGDVLSSITPEGAPAYDTPTRLWEALRGRDAMTIAHHSSGNPIPINWTYPPDPVLEPVTEIVSVHGSSEARDSPSVVAGSRDGNFVRDALDRGFDLGLIGSGDSHDGHPGLPHLSPGYGWRPATGSRNALSGTGGLAAIRSDSAHRKSVLEALRSRACYATSGPRIAVRHRATQRGIRLLVAGTAPLRALDLVTGPEGEVVGQAIDPGAIEVDITIPGAAVAGRGYAYVRVVQVDGGAAWCRLR